MEEEARQVGLVWGRASRGASHPPLVGGGKAPFAGGPSLLCLVIGARVKEEARQVGLMCEEGLALSGLYQITNSYLLKISWRQHSAFHDRSV